MAYRERVLSGLVYLGIDRNPCSSLYESEWTLHEMPTQITVESALLRSLEDRYGPRKRPLWSGSTPPEFDVLTSTVF